MNIASINTEKSIEISSSLNRLIIDNSTQEYKNIGFIHYIIEEIEQKIYMDNIDLYDIETVINKIHEFELKYRTKSVSWLEI